jgi:hypothetical protein
VHALGMAEIRWESDIFLGLRVNIVIFLQGCFIIMVVIFW